jgi:hypothetical protein
VPLDWWTALALLDEGAGPSQFLFLHLFDAHAPYSPPGDILERFGSRPEDVPVFTP